MTQERALYSSLCSESGDSSLAQALAIDLNWIPLGSVLKLGGIGTAPVVLSFACCAVLCWGCRIAASALAKQVGQGCSVYLLQEWPGRRPWEKLVDKGHLHQMYPSPMEKAALLFPGR